MLSMYIAKIKTLMSCTVTVSLIGAFIFAYEKRQVFLWQGLNDLNRVVR